MAITGGLKLPSGPGQLDNAGLGIDFKILKKQTNQLLDELDHKYLNDLEPFKLNSPSSENISCYLFERLSESLNSDNVTVERVNVWESDNACASYTRD